MVAKKPRIVIIGAGMAGLTAANRLYTYSAASDDLFDICVVEGGARIGGRIRTSEFCGDRIEMGATWIHGIGGSPVHNIAQEIHALESEQPWECMHGFPESTMTVAEGGFELNPTIVDPVSTLFKKLMDFAQGKMDEEDGKENQEIDYCKLAAMAFEICQSNGGVRNLSVGAFLQQGLNVYWESVKGSEDFKELEEAIFAVHENTQRTYTSAGDLKTLDYSAEREYIMCSGEEITIAKGYLSIIESLASVLPPGLVQLGRKVTKIEWQPKCREATAMENGSVDRPVSLHFSDGSIMAADHVILTVSLGVLKANTGENSGMFSPPLPSFKIEAISRLGFGVVNKLFVEMTEKSRKWDKNGEDLNKFPFLQMAFHGPDSELRHKNIPWWMRKTASLCPIYNNSSVLLSWFAGEEALELESLSDEEVLDGVSTTISSFLTHPHKKVSFDAHELCNGNVNSVKFSKVLKTQWGNDPLFLGSYSYVAVGSSGDDMDTMAEPLPKKMNICEAASSPSLQILFAGEATHRTHYSTTHGAYFSGLREANRLLQHYHCVGF